VESLSSSNAFIKGGAFHASPTVTHMALAEGGKTVNGGEQPKLRPYPGRYVTLAGLHVARLPFAVHVTEYRYFRQGRSGIAGSSDWINLSFEYRF